MPLKKTLIIALILSIAGLAAWEIYWRSRGYIADLDDEKNLWAVQRARLEKFSDEDFVVVGSSRALFDIQLDEWEAATGRRPLMLASPGSSPLPVFRDIVENTDFKGTIIVGVTAGLFFSTTFPQASPWKRPQTKVDHYHKRTYAQRFNHWVSIPIQKSFAFISANEEEWDDDIDLKALLKRIQIGNRTGKPPAPPFYNFSTVELDRNTTMTERTATDTAFANTVKRVWKFFNQNRREPETEKTLAFFEQDAKKFMDRGGNLILLRCPSSGYLKEMEDERMPREKFWDVLVKRTGAKGYYFEDYESLRNFECPEWSHLSGPDAKIFTTELTKILITDGVIQSK